MIRYIAKRFLMMIPLLFGMSFMIFMLIHLAPGDIMAQYKFDPRISQETLQRIQAKHHFDKPVVVQYGFWLKNLFLLDFGYSFTKKAEVWSVLKARLFNTFILSFTSILLTWIIAVPLGVFSAVHQYSVADRIFSFIAFIGMSLPSFFIALLFLYGVSLLGVLPLLGKLPIGGMMSPTFSDMNMICKLFDVAKHLLIPALVLVIGAIAGLQRITRGNLLEVLRAQYVTTARAKGLPENRVIYKHALRNAINPLITLLGYEFSALLSGAALTEIICSWPGLGSVMLEAVRSQDVFLVMGGMMMGSILLIVGNLMADILLVYADPRIRVQE
jgi:peptide/nickel transport system permease protein